MMKVVDLRGLIAAQDSDLEREPRRQEDRKGGTAMQCWRWFYVGAHRHQPCYTVQDSDLEREVRKQEDRRGGAAMQRWRWFYVALIGIIVALLSMAVNLGIAGLNWLRIKTTERFIDHSGMLSCHCCVHTVWPQAMSLPIYIKAIARPMRVAQEPVMILNHSTAVEWAAPICALSCASNGMQVISGGHTSSMWDSRPSTPSSLRESSHSGRQRLPALACQRSRCTSVPACSD